MAIIEVPAVINLTGTAEFDSANLPEGPEGPPGAEGTDGLDGLNGADGAQGPPGEAGGSGWTQIDLDAPYTLTSQTAAQPLLGTFDVTLEADTKYAFQCMLSLSALASGAFGFALLGQALSFERWQTLGGKGSSPTQAVASLGTMNVGPNLSIVATGPGAAGYATVWGTLRTGAAGIIMPGVSMTTAAAAIVGIDSYFRIKAVV